MKQKEFLQVCGKDVKVQGRLIKIARLDGEKFTFPDDPEAMLDGLRKYGTRMDLFTFLQRLPGTSPQYPYFVEWENLAVVPVSTYDNWWTKQIDNKTRNMVRKAGKKDVVVRETQFNDALLRGICEIYNECPVRHGKRFPHYGMDIERARAYAGTFLDRSIFIGAFLGDKMIGFIKMVTDETQTHACVIHILSMLRHRDKAPTNALVAQAVRTCAERGIRYLVYEHFTYGKKPQDSLTRFKEVNGFERTNIPRYYIPLTAAGSLALRLGLHHRFVDRLPEPFMAKLRDLRTAWYQRRFESATEAG